ncbi:hypothetical protein BH11BAC3_BH11BAC3_11870 [soil metagenome]
MEQSSLKKASRQLHITLVAGSFFIISLLLFSFTAIKLTDDFFKQLGITKTDADKKITNSILGGYLDEYGVLNAKNIVAGNRTAVVKNLLTYCKQQVNSAAFIKEYSAIKEREKPAMQKIETPEEMRAGEIAMYKKSISETEANLKKADASLKSIFEEVLTEAKKGLKEAENPANKNMAAYKNGYADLVKSMEESYKQQLQQWETKYPANQLLFVKKRLQQFLAVTKDIDFAALLTERNGKKYFVNREYEHKGKQWKMAFRAGKEVIVPAREMVQQWIEEIR